MSYGKNHHWLASTVPNPRQNVDEVLPSSVVVIAAVEEFFV
jgi:hypothetical protein